MRPDQTRRTTRPAYGAIVALLVCLVTAGCTGGGDKTPASSSHTATPGTTSPNSTTSASSPASSTATSSTSPGGTASDPNVPAAARADTAAGAEAFTSYFLNEVNRAYSTNDPSLISGLSLTACKTCVLFSSSVQQIKSARQTFVGQMFVVTTVTIAQFSASSAETFVSTDTPARKIVDSSGVTIQTAPAERAAYTIYLTWAFGWKVSEVKVAA